MPEMNRLEYNGPTIDTHAFLGQSEAFGVPNPTDKYYKDPAFAGIKFLVMPFSAKDNISVSKKVEGNPQMLGSYLMFNPNETSTLWVPQDNIQQLRLASNQEHVVGMKTHPSMYRLPMNDKKYDLYYKHASRERLPVLVHAASSGKKYDSAEMAVEVMERFPEMKLILAHFGGLKPGYMEEAAKLLDKFPNLYLNTTGLAQMGRNNQVSNITHERTVLNELIKEEVDAMKRDALGVVRATVVNHPKKILHGSDFGFHDPAEYSFWPLRELTIGQQLQILYLNPKRLFTNMKAA